MLDICRGKLLDATFWVVKRQVHCNNRFWFFRPCYVPIICERTLFAGDAPNHVRDTSSRPVGSRLGQICLATLSKKSSFDLCFSYCRHCKVELIIGCLKKNIPGEGYCHVVDLVRCHMQDCVTRMDERLHSWDVSVCLAQQAPGRLVCQFSWPNRLLEGSMLDAEIQKLDTKWKIRRY